MNWDEVVRRITPYVVKIETPAGHGTGFLCLYTDERVFCGIATAHHVVAHADNWQQPIRIIHHASNKAALLKEDRRVIFPEPSRDSAMILVDPDDFGLPEALVPLLPLETVLPIGAEVGWIGYPAVRRNAQCFFSGRVSSFDDSSHAYLIDGVAINGPSRTGRCPGRIASARNCKPDPHHRRGPPRSAAGKRKAKTRRAPAHCRAAARRSAAACRAKLTHYLSTSGIALGFLCLVRLARGTRRSNGIIDSMTRSACIAQLAASIAAVTLEHPTRVAIDGVDGVGKTTLADELVEPLTRMGRQVIRASVDGFHRPQESRYRRGADSPEGYFLDSFDYPALISALLDPLGPGGTRRFRRAVFDYRRDRPVNVSLETAPADAILLFDGIFLQRPELAEAWDVRIWVDAPFEITVARAIIRDAGQTDRAAILAKYEERYVPGQRMYMDQCGPRDSADILVGNADLESPDLRYRTLGQTAQQRDGAACAGTDDRRAAAHRERSADNRSHGQP